jgi:hypothetical protein
VDAEEKARKERREAEERRSVRFVRKQDSWS